MIICTNKMEYRLRSQCQRVQKQQVMVNGEKDRVSLLVMKALVSRGSVDAVSQQMATHPQYLESFLRTQHYILHMDGPLPLPYRHYIAIMLLKAGEQCWSLAELVQAVVILAHCHSLCSFVCGCDVNPDFVLFSKSPNDTLPAFSPYDAANGNTNVPQSLAAPSEHRTRRRSLESSCEMVFLRERIQKSQEERDKREEQFLQTHQQTTEEEEEMICFADPSRFITDPDFCYQEFSRREEDRFQVLRIQQDYSWEDHGFSLVNRLYSDIGHLLDDRFRSVATLPSLHSPDLKRAVWNYIHFVLGIYDDYDYGEVNQLLEPDLKLYIKAVACFPDATKTLMCPLSLTAAKSSERTHINLLIMEARLQAELLYALRAITQYMIT
uniref:Uncharacterized protein n=2 Tax=Oryzias latipes TaxID=8090 RepID=A0A3P9I622_ORYLA